VLFTPISGWASDRIDARYLMTLGYLFYAAFGLCMTFADLRLSAFALLIIYFGRGLGLGLSYAVIYPIAISGLEAARGKAATTLLNLCVTLGGALNVSLLAAILEQRQQVRYAWLAETQVLAAARSSLALAGGGRHTRRGPATISICQILSRLLDQESLLRPSMTPLALSFLSRSVVSLWLSFAMRVHRPADRD
jgi:DHA2 family multidrug resistance protein